MTEKLSIPPSNRMRFNQKAFAGSADFSALI